MIGIFELLITVKIAVAAYDPDVLDFGDHFPAKNAPKPVVCKVQVLDIIPPTPDKYHADNIWCRASIDSGFWHANSGLPLGMWCEMYRAKWVECGGCIVSRKHRCLAQKRHFLKACEDSKSGKLRIDADGDPWHERFCQFLDP